MLNENVVSKDERTNAALAHASIVLGFFSRGVLGIVLAFLIWITQRDKSQFAARHAAQALVWQLIGIAATVGVWIAWFALFAGSIFVPVLVNPSRPEPMMPYTMIPAVALIVVPFGLMFAWVAVGVYAAWRVWHGNDYSYPVVGRWVK